MELNYTSIDKFQAIQSGDNLIIIGMGSDQFMYQYHGEDGMWVRLSTRFPNQIILATPPIMEPEIVAPVEAPVEASAEAPAA